jgi:hypothetical protein
VSTRLCRIVSCSGYVPGQISIVGTKSRCWLSYASAAVTADWTVVYSAVRQLGLAPAEAPPADTQNAGSGEAPAGLATVSKAVARARTPPEAASRDAADEPDMTVS